MRHRSHLSAAERKARSRLAQMVHDRPFVCGSIVTMKNVCGKKNCKCARGDKHVSMCLAMRDGGERKMIHVPKQFEETIEEWVDNYKEVKALMDEVSRSCLDQFKAEKKKVRKNQERRKGQK